MTLQSPADHLEEIFAETARLLGFGSKRRKVPRAFAHVIETAQPFVAATFSRHFANSKQDLWIVCRTEREQERFHGELSTWIDNALLFPHLEVAAVEGAIPDPETSAERLGVLQKISERANPWVIVLNQKSLDDEVYSPKELSELAVHLHVGEQLDRQVLLDQLVQAGYEPTSQIAERGQYSVRGGIVDVYAWQLVQPLRIEWFGDEITSIREFDLDQQSSIRQLQSCSLVLNLPERPSRKLREYHKKEDVLLSVEDALTEADLTVCSGDRLGADGSSENYADAFFESPLRPSKNQVGGAALRDLHSKHVHEQFSKWMADGWKICIQYKKRAEESEIRRFIDDFTPGKNQVVFRQSSSDGSFVFPAGKLVVVTAAEIFLYGQTGATTQPLAVRNRRGLARQRVELNYTNLKVGDLVVHLEHGLARYRGTEARAVMVGSSGGDSDSTEEFMVLEFADQAKLFVPLEQAFLVSRYVGIGKRGAMLSKLGDGKWSNTKKAAEKSIYDYAAKLLKTQAVRETHHGRVFKPDSAWQKEFEDAFPYKETTDQLRAIADAKRDMESGRAMDRLICGDVGFGKTEVAIRVAFKAVNDGVQAAMMVPTTVLAQQHYESFKARMANFPVQVELLSRYRTAAEQSQVARGLADGTVDLVIGTHRLISKDVAFKNLGLLIVDEEQRFGVRHKERIKERFPAVDVLTLSATPIPRTLYLALTGARDLSTLETPPPSRFPVETLICGYDERIIRTAIDRELDRQGQVYFLHNRVESIAKVAARVKQLCPRAKVDVGHGQMEEGQLEEVMHRFVRGETDVLVATTIIESGLDIPNANTIIIDRADRFGLADLYQLRGRVGRGQHKAYAYLMLPRDLMTVGEARKRINAIKQYSSLGAGFKIALRDLEIRGAGNILGVAQSGHLTAVGFDLYCQLLRQAVATLRGEKVRSRLEVGLRLDFVAANETDYRHRAEVFSQAGQADPTEAASIPPTDEPTPVEPWPAYLPADYIEDSTLRVQAYRQLAAIVEEADAAERQKNWRDRFGPLPPPAENLLALSRLKVAAASRRIEQLEVRGDKVMATRGGEYVQFGGKFPRLTSPEPGDKIRQILGLIESLRPVFSGPTNRRDQPGPSSELLHES